MNRFVFIGWASCGVVWWLAWLALAARRYSNEWYCLRFTGPWLPCANIEWRWPALLSLLPLVLLVCWTASRLTGRRRYRTPRE